MQTRNQSSLAARVLTRVLAWTAAAAMASALAGCGQKGPLSLPKAPSAASAPAR